jgi:hypothetical protein
MKVKKNLSILLNLLATLLESNLEIWQYLLIISQIPAMETPKFKLFLQVLIFYFNTSPQKKKLVRCILIIHLLASLHGSKT